MFGVIEKWDKCHSKLSYVIGDVTNEFFVGTDNGTDGTNRDTNKFEIGTDNVTNPVPMEQ